MPIEPARTFRVFISSTFADLVEERSVLQKQVFPRLRALCEKHGSRFQPVDLRWGVSEEAGRDQRTMWICLEEIKRCQETTPRPNFMVLLGDRYGWRPLPSEIPVDDVARMRVASSLAARMHIFERLYPDIDRNAVPPVYCLRARAAGIEPEWAAMEREVLTALEDAAGEAGLPLTQRVRYGGSATEQEIVAGLLRDEVLQGAREHVHAFFRNIRDMPDSVDARMYLDWTETGPDGGAIERQNALKQRLRTTLGSRVHEYLAHGTGPGAFEHLREPEIDSRTIVATVGGGAKAAAAPSTRSLCEDVYEALAQTIQQEAGKFEQLDSLGREIQAHDRFAAERSRLFVGRASALEKIADYLKRGCSRPLAVAGASGTGKSTAMARALSDARRDYPAAAIAARFIGTTPESSSGMSLLASLARQIAQLYGQTAPLDYAEYPRLASAFRDCLKAATLERPLVVFVDALDQLPGSDDARSLSWLPLDELPDAVRLVVSVSSDSPALYEALRTRLDDNQVARLDPMPPEEADRLLNLWLEDVHRQLEPVQRESLLDGFRSSGLPLYLRFAFEQGKLWRSFDEPRPAGSSLRQIIGQTFAELSDPANHGAVLVSRSLGYLTAAKDGLAEDEILEVLSADPEVMSDFRSRFPKSPHADQFPMVVWSRLYYDLKPYLAERGAQGAAVLNYFHRQMRDAAESEYLKGKAETQRHTALAKYFESKPNHFGENGSKTFNARKLSELPYQQRKSGMWEELEATLCDLSFIEDKCAAGLIYDLLADYAAALRSADAGSRKARIGSFERFVRAQAHLLSTHPGLTFQQALNEPDATQPAQAAARLAAAEQRPRMRWINKSQSASPCVLTIYGHTSYVNGCDVSPDGTRIASASSDESIKIWNLTNGKEELALRRNRISIESCNFSPDGKRIVSGARDGEITMWDAASGAVLWSRRAHGRPIPTCKFDPGGGRVVSSSWDGRVKVWNAENGAELLTLEGHAVDACSCQFSPDGDRIISAGGDGFLKLWDAGTGATLGSVRAHEQEIMCCRFSSDGRWIFTSSQDTYVKRWDATTLALLTTYEGHGEGVWSVAVSSQRLASGAKDGCIKLWDLETGAELASMREHANEVWDLAFLPDGDRFASASWDGTVKVWDVKTAEEGAVPPEAAVQTSHPEATPLWGYMIACCCSPGGKYYAGGSSDGSVRIWEAATGAVLGVFPIHRDFIFTCAFSPDERWLASGAWDGAVKVFDLEAQQEVASESMPTLVAFCAFTHDGKQLIACCTTEIRMWAFAQGRLTGPVSWMAGDEPFVGCAVMPDGKTISAGRQNGRFSFWDTATNAVVGSLDGPSGLITFTLSPDGRLISGTWEDTAVRIWDVRTQAQILELRGHRERAVSCNFSPDGRRLVTGSWDRQVRIWNLEAPEHPMVLIGHRDQLQDACFTPDGTRILSSGVDRTVRLWDAQSGAALGALLWPADEASNCLFSPDGRHVVTASHRHAIKVWSAESGELLRILSRHGEAVRACVFSADGKLLSASADGTLQLWDLERNAPLSILRGHRGPVQSCAFSPDGAWIASASQDRTVKLWDSQTGATLATLEGHEDWVQRVMVIANGRRIASYSLDRTVRIWDVATRSTLHVLRGNETAIGAAAVAPDGVRIVAGGEDGVLHVWDTESGVRIATLPGHRGAIRSCACAGAVVSASQDGTLRIWELETGRLRASLEGHQGSVQACLFSPDGRHIVSGSEDQFLKLWNAATGRQIAEYWIGSAVLSLSWRTGSGRIAAGDAMGRMHLLELADVFR
jgi:NACHT domain- and WD repeat-containing protein